MKKIILFLFFVLFNVLSTWGQVEIGTGTATQRYPLGNYYGFERSASLYTAAEVTGVGNIATLSWYATTAGLGARPIVIYLKEIEEEELTAVAWDVLTNGATKVYEGSITPVLGWNDFSVTTPFNFTGTKNLLVLVEANYGDSGNGNGTEGNSIRYTTAARKQLTIYRDTSPPTSNGILESNRPNIKIAIPIPNCSAPPSIANAALGVTTARFTVPSPSSPLGYEYEVRTSGEPGSGAVGLVQNNANNTNVFDVAGLLANTNYVIYIRALCTVTDRSVWKMFRFTTLRTGQIGWGPQATSNLPIQSNYAYNYSQQIYLAEEVVGAVGVQRYITRIKFHFTSSAITNNYKDWKIFMGNTSKSNFESTASTEWVPVSTMTTVFNGEVTFPNPSGDWMEINLTEPFLWDGTSNIVVGVHEYTPNYTGGASFRSLDTSPAFRGLHFRNDSENNNPNPNWPPTANQRYTFVPQIILVGEQIPDCVGVSNQNYTDVRENSVKINWENTGNLVQQTEYYLANTLEAPTDNTLPTAVMNATDREVILTGLSEGTQYYVWLRNVCQNAQKSNWSAIPLDFMTALSGQLGEGNRVMTALPISSNFNFNFSQQIYLAEELQAALQSNNYIRGIKFHINVRDTEENQAKYKDWTIYLGSTEKVQFDSLSNTEWVPVSQLIKVFDGALVFPNPTNDWMEIVFAEPFLWDTNSNLILGVYENTPGSGNAFDTAEFRIQHTQNNRAMLSRSGSNWDLNQLPAPSMLYKAIPQIVLTATPPPPCLPISTFEYTNLASDSVQFNWTNREGIRGVEYYISTFDYVPDVDLEAAGEVLFPDNQLILTGLNDNTSYHIWFRVLCDDETRSEWSVYPKTFTTLFQGQIGVGDLLTASLPLHSDNLYNYSQQIYLASEVLGAVGTDRYISKIKFYFDSNNATATYSDWKIFIGNTSKDRFEGTATVEWVAAAAMTVVFDGAVAFPSPTGNWMEINLAEPFLWDGSSNIVVGVHEYTPGKLAGANFRRMDTGEVYRGLLAQTDENVSVVNPYNSPIATSRFKYVPQIILNAEPTPDCLGVSSYSYSYVGVNAAVINWTNLVSGLVATEYFLSTDRTQAPTATSLATGRVLAGITQVALSNLTEDTQYYVWFRNQCNATEKSAWSAIPLAFKTHIQGLFTDDGTSTSAYLPLYSTYSYNYSQQLYLSSEVKAVLGIDGRKYITKLKFHVSLSSTSIWNRYVDWNIFMGNTTKEEFEGNQASNWVPTSAMRQVFDGVVSFPNPTDDWMEITLHDPFVWDGVSNLVIGVNEYTPSYSSGASFRKLDTPGQRGMLHYSDVNRQSINNLPDASMRVRYVPQLFLEMEAMPNCFPPTAVGVTDIGRYSATVNWSAPFEGVPANGYEYEIRTEGEPGSGSVGFVVMGSVTNAVFTANLTSLLPATSYTVYVRARCDGRNISPWTVGVSFTTSCEYPDFDLADEVQVCGQGTVDLMVNITGIDGTFKWYDVATGGRALAEGPTFTTPLLTATKSYWVEGSTGEVGNLCLTPTGRKRVTIKVTDAVPFELSDSTFTICEGATTAVVSYLGDLSVYDTHTWSPATGVSGDIQNGWVFNPVITTEYVLTAKQQSGDFCEFARKVTVIVTPLPVVNFSPEKENVILCKEEVLAFAVEDVERNYLATVGQAETLTGTYEDISAFNNRRRNVRAQLLFTAAELRENGVSKGLLKSISFNTTTPGEAFDNANYTIRIATTAIDKFETTNYVSTAFTTVYGPVSHVHTESGWQEIVFDRAFEWDGESNLIIEFSHSGIDSLENARTYYTRTTENRLLFGYNDTSTPDLSKIRFNIRFFGERILDIKWFPVENIYMDAAATVPYLYNRDTPVNQVFYKAAVEGFGNLVATVNAGNGCPLVKNFNHRTVVITNAQATNQEFCGVARISDLVATGQDGASFRWYPQMEGGSALASTTLVTTRTYYVTQAIGHCESATRIPVRVEVNPKPSDPIVLNSAVCIRGTLADLNVNYDAANSLNWYDADYNLIVGNIMLEEQTLYVSQTSGNCESDRVRVDVVVGTVPDTPVAHANQLYCGVAQVANLAMDLMPTAVARWYRSMESTDALSPNELLETGDYYGAQVTRGCESARVMVRVVVGDFMETPKVQSQNICNTNTTVAQLQASGLPGADIHWYSAETGGVPLGANQVVYSGLYYVSQQIGDCESARVRVGIQVVDNNTAPNAQAQSFCGQAKVQDLYVRVGTGFIVKWYTQQEGGAALNEAEALQTGAYYVSQSIYHCESPRKRVEVMVNPIPITPTGNAVQEFESGFTAVVGDLMLNESNIIWFSSEEDALNDINRLGVDMPLIDGDFYYGVVESLDGCLSLPYKVQVIIKLGVNNFDLTNLNYYPNPVTDMLTISYKETITRVEVYALTGQRVLTRNVSDNVVLLDMSKLAAATYVVKIYSKKQQQFLKILKY